MHENLRQRRQVFLRTRRILHCFLTGVDTGALDDQRSDFAVVSSGRLSVSPILVQPQVPAGFLSGREFR